MRPSFLGLLAFASLALSAPSRDLLVKETIAIPDGWKRVEEASPTHVLSLRLALAQPNMDRLHERLYEVSDPDHELYGRHLSKKEVEQLTAPSDQDRLAVREWLESNGINSGNGMLKRSTANGDWIDLKIPVAKARDLFGADFHLYEHSETGEKLVRTTQYSLPAQVHRSIDTVTGTTYFNRVEANKISPNIELLPLGWTPEALRVSSEAVGPAPASCNTNATTMTCLRELYGTIDYVPTARQGNFIGIGSFLEQHATIADLRAFEKTERPDAFAANYTFDVQLIAGGTNVQDAMGSEADLDVQTVTGIAFPINSTLFSTGGRPPIQNLPAGEENDNEPYSEYFSYLLSLDDKDLPSVISNSYGEAERTVPEAYARKVCNQIASLTSRGVSVLFSSGDSGVGAGNCTETGKKLFLPAFPAGCPFVTAVGGLEAYAPEQAVSTAIGGYYGGGGRSSYFTAPLYQLAAISSYQLKLGKKNFNYYNHFGRAYPDVSAQASRFLVHTGGRYARIGGTSASAPLFSSIVALLNDARLAAGKPLLGFLNPLIYKRLGNSKGFTDITKGSNNGCGTDGFPATENFDFATGWGSPNFKELVKLVV